MATLQLLHTADIHLNAPNESLGERAAALRECVWEAYERVIDLALERGVDAVVIAGDLFDTREPDPTALRRAFAQLGRLAAASPPVHVVLLPGTHDCWSEGGLWESLAVRRLPETVHVLAGPGPTSCALAERGVAFHGCAHICGRGGQRPLSELRADEGADINVGIAHGSHERGDIEADSSMFSAEEIAATGMDYLALGHWHSWHDLSAGAVTAINPGSPEVHGLGDQERGAVALVTLGEGAARVERVTVGRLYCRELEIDVADLAGTEQLILELTERGDAQLLLRVLLRGLAPPGVLIDLDAVRERVADDFFALDIEDASHPALEELGDADLDTHLVLGKFVELARERIVAAETERERRIAERALQIGVSMLRGKGGA